jgi:uncharacterized protein (DUF433 family)
MAMAQTVIDWSRCPVLERKPDTQGGAWVFRGTRVPVTAILRNLSELSVPELSQEFSTVRRRAKAAGIKTKIGNHSLRATGITDYLKSAGTLENAQQMANHSLDEYEKVGI